MIHNLQDVYAHIEASSPSFISETLPAIIKQCANIAGKRATDYRPTILEPL